MPIISWDIQSMGVFPIAPKETDRYYLGLRLITVVSMVGWITFSPLSADQKLPLYGLIALFALSTLIFIVAGLLRKEGYGHLYIYLLVPDIAVLTGFIHKAEPYGEYFAIGYFIATALAAYYYGVGAGYMAAAVTSIANVIRMNYLSSQRVFAADQMLQLALIWITAFTVGRVAKRVQSSHRKIEDLNKELERKITTLSSLSRIALSATDLRKLVYLFRETLEKAFKINSYRFYMIDQESKAIVIRIDHHFSHDVDGKIADAILGNLHLIRSSMVLEEESLVNPIGAEARIWYLPGLKECAAVVRCGAETVGVLCLDNNFVAEHDKEGIDVLVSVFNQLAVSMENAILYDHLKKSSITDHLTHLYNRRYLQGYLTDEVKRCRRYDKELSVVILDLDDFKAYNDSFGHLQGDGALQELADILRGSCRSADIVARYGGEEFVIVLPETSLPGALAVIEKVRDVVASHRFLGRNALRNMSLTCSFGVATFPKDGLTGRELLSSADKALYLAKTTGKNRILAFRDLKVGGSAY